MKNHDTLSNIFVIIFWAVLFPIAVILVNYSAFLDTESFNEVSKVWLIIVQIATGLADAGILILCAVVGITSCTDKKNKNKQKEEK